MFGLKYFKRIKSSLICCGIPLERAARYVGIADVCFGLLFIAAIFLHLNEVKDHVPEGEQSLGFLLAFLPKWLSLVILTSHSVKFLMGIILYIGIVIKSRAICGFWLFASVFSVLFAFPMNLIHLYEMFIVNQFRQEIIDELSRLRKTHPASETPQKFPLENFMITGPIEHCIPTGDNNNEWKYVGFGNTTLLPTDKLEGSELSSLEVSTALYPSSVKSREPERRYISKDKSANAFQNVDKLQDGSDDRGEIPELRISSRYYGLVPTTPPRPMPLPPPWKIANIIPIVVVTMADDTVVAM